MDLLWENIIKVLEEMIITKSEMLAVDQIRGLERARGEDNLTFVSKAHMIYKSMDWAGPEQECISCLFVKLSVEHQQRILDVFEIKELSFDRQVAYYQRKGRQESFMSMEHMRSGMVSAMQVANRRT